MMHAALALALATIFATPSQEDLEKAKTYFEAGRRAYELGDFATALSAFTEANALAPRPAIVFSMAQACRQQYYLERDPALLDRAIALYDQYLAEEKGGRRNDALRFRQDLAREKERAPVTAPREQPNTSPDQKAKTQLMISTRTEGARASIDGGEPQEMPLIAEVTPGEHDVKVTAEGFISSVVKQTAVEARLVVAEINLREKPAVIHVSAPDGARVILDGRLIGEAPMLVPLQVAAGPHSVAVTQAGRHAFVSEVSVGRGEDVSVVATLDTTAQRDVSYYFMGGGAVLFAVTGGTVIGALVAGGRARFIRDKLDLDHQNLSINERDEYNDLRGLRGDLVTASSGFLAGSVALGLTGGLLYFLDDEGIESRRVAVPEPSEVTFVPIIDSDGLGAAVVGRF